MKLSLSKTEIRVLLQLCKSEMNIGTLARSIKAKESFASRVVKCLSEKGLVFAEKSGTAKTVRLSPASHAQAFKQLADSRPGSSLDWLSGAAVDLLIVSNYGMDVRLFYQEIECSKPTAYKTLKKLEAAGMLLKANGRIKISNRLIGEFASAFASNMQRIIQSGVHGGSIRLRKHVVLRTDAKEVPEAFVLTGISALAKMGLEANIASYKDYYFNLNGKKASLSTEEYLIHALWINTLQQQNTPVLAIFFAKNKKKFSMQKLVELAEIYLVEDELNGLRRDSEFYDKSRDFE